MAESLLHRAAKANGGDGVFEPLETKVGCYCYSQNCFGDESGIGCSWCVELAMEKGDPVDKVEPGVCHYGCSICACACQAKFEERYGASLGGALCFINNPTLRVKSRRVFTFGALRAS